MNFVKELYSLVVFSEKEDSNLSLIRLVSYYIENIHISNYKKIF